MKSDKFKGSFLLLLAALIWGSSFIVMKSAVDFLTPNVLSVYIGNISNDHNVL